MDPPQAVDENKQQGAIDAARDPESSVTADDAQREIVENSKEAGIAAFTFNPDASTEEKNAQARAAIPTGFHRRPKGVAIATDIDDGSKADIDLPSPSKAGAVEVAKGEDGKPLPNGHASEGAVMGEMTGWAPRFGWPADEEEDSSLLDHTTWLESRLSDAFFGDWYHNAGVIFFACISSWLVAVLGGGLGWVFIVMAVCSTYYRTSIRRVRQNFRDDITREVAMKKLETDNESVEWINSFLVKFWPIYQPVLAQTVINSVDQVLSGATPAFLDSLKLKTFTLGSKPPRMEHVKTYPKADDDIVIMDWLFSFTPNDTADMTSRQLINKVNPKVILEIRVGKAMISKGLDVIVENMAFSGLMRLKIKLQIPFPHVEKIEMCFLERPSIDYVCKPLGGETFGFDINFIPGLESFIQEQIHGSLAPMMYAPNVFPIEVAKMLAGTPVDQAIGVIGITIHGAQGLKNSDSFSGTPDPYATVSLNGRQTLAKTKTIKENGSPRWNETHYIIVTSFNDALQIEVFDYNEFRKDKRLGMATFPLENVEDLNEYENERLELHNDGKAKGIITCDIRFFPVLEAAKTPDGTVEPPPESNTGILRFTVEQAKELDSGKSMIGLLNPYATLLLNSKEIHVTKKLKRTNNPVWDNGSKEMLITDRKNAKLGVAVKDDRDIAGDQLVGTYQIKLDDILDLMSKGQDWYNLIGVKTGRVKMMAQWKPVALTGVGAGTGGYQTPVGVLRVHFQNAKQLRNFEALGKSDPYARVLMSGIEKARTVTFKNNLNPEWDEVLYIPVHSGKERLQLEVMDAENVGRDRSLGLTEIISGDFMSQGENGEWLVRDDKLRRSEGLRIHGKGAAKGMLNYTVAFYPCLNIADPAEEEERKKKEEEERKKHERQKDSFSEHKKSLDTPRSPEAGKFSTTLGSKEVGKPAPARKESSRPVTPLTPATPTSTAPRKSREDREPPKLYLTPQELLKYESGLVIFKLMDADLPKSGTRIEVFVDDMAFASYTSSTAKTKTHKFDEYGDCFIRELDFSKLTVKICEPSDKQDEAGKQHTLAKLTGRTVDTLRQCLNNPTTLQMKDDQGNVYSIKISLKYVPVKMQLDPSESINNMGNLRVDILDAQDLPSADSNGKSDPFVKFELNGAEVFKSKTQKKTLHPAWNEYFEVPVPSRTAARFKATVYDYDFADKPDFLGATEINLTQLDTFQAREFRYKLDGKSGTLRLRLLFRPDYVTRSKQGTSTFSGTFAVPGKIVTGAVGAPIKGGAAVVGAVGHGVGMLKRGFRSNTSKKDDDSDTASSTNIPIITTNGPDPTPGMGLKRSTGLAIQDGDKTPPTPEGRTPGIANGGFLHHSRTRSAGASSIHSAIFAGGATGTATFTIASASGFPPSTDVYVSVTQMKDGKSKVVGKTKHHKSATGTVSFDETFKVSCSPDSQFKVEAREHHTLKSDDVLGESLYFVDDTNTGQEKPVNVGNGTVVIKSSFALTENSLTPDSPKSGGGVRRSFLSKRESRVPSRETTPIP
ncbi:C2 domain-containing protein [Lasiosphaeria miniovina]|uniref:C2 domain-containing protein n=1 Tax=Lasiosphaeria miniovina TaxID=1954250 RepID=A0AA40BIU4_9PEZI|nr:C2 domain-containing protein [Lasiosphaeria miniovina]KAK0735013.1 C2 domain-containing protein [Lasiosphaeria miniovina]